MRGFRSRVQRPSAHAQGIQLCRVETVNGAWHTAESLQLAVMEHERHAIARELHIELDPARAESQRIEQRSARVLRMAG